MGAASLVLGIIALVLSFISPIIALPLGIIAVVLGAVGKKKGKKNSTGGLVCGIIAVALSAIMWIACVACATAASGLF